MGTWGPGNFEDDAAGDHLAALTHQLIEQIEEVMADPERLEPDEDGGSLVPCNADILVLLSRQNWIGAALPDVATATRWRDQLMAAWDESIDGLDPAPGFKDERRAVLTRTFASLIEAAQARAG